MILQGMDIWTRQEDYTDEDLQYMFRDRLEENSNRLYGIKVDGEDVVCTVEDN